MNRYNQIIINFFTKGHERSIKAKINILVSLIIKGLSIAISLVLVPLTINYINPSRYGIWLTISSIVAWFSFFDIGLTQGLRNKFAEAKAKGEDNLAQILVSTTYAILAIIFCVIWVIFIIANFFLNWASILNVSESMQSEISILAVIVFTYFCLQFVLRIITTLLMADQQSAKSSVIDLLGQILSLVLISILVITTKGSLVKLGVALCISPLLVLFGANLFFFKGSFNRYHPRFSKIKFSHATGLFKLGVIFFIIQVAALIQYQTANIIIARNFGTLEVTSYNIVYKYFGILSMVFMIFIGPFWSASTEAFLKNDIKWVRNGIRKYNQLNIAMFILSCIMLFFSDTIYRLWLGEGKVKIEFSLSLWGFLFFNIVMFGSKYVNFLNGINALRIQFWTSLFTPFLYIGIAILLIDYLKMGVCSLFIAALLASANAYFIAPLQYYQIVVKRKRGIWIR
jgi:O-antigen/teichoic acid export membrane protein